MKICWKNFAGRKMKTIAGSMLIVFVLALTGCSTARRPVLYPNDHHNRVGEQQAEADINACMRAAEASGANANRNEDVARKTAKAGAVGGATGAVVGAISSNTSTGRGAPGFAKACSMVVFRVSLEWLTEGKMSANVVETDTR